MNENMTEEKKVAKAYGTLNIYADDVETINKIKSWLHFWGMIPDPTQPETVKFLVALFKGQHPDALKEAKP